MISHSFVYLNLQLYKIDKKLYIVIFGFEIIQKSRQLIKLFKDANFDFVLGIVISPILDFYAGLVEFE